jgi:hypothetical protein
VAVADATIATKAMADRRNAVRKNGWLRIFIANLPTLTEIAKSVVRVSDVTS